MSLPEPDAPILYVTDVDRNPIEIADVRSLIQQSSELAGDIVRLDAAVFQTAISVQEAMEATTVCGDNRVQTNRAFFRAMLSHRILRIRQHIRLIWIIVNISVERDRE